MTCTWEADPAGLGDAWDQMDPEDRERALMLATSSLQALTYNRVGACPVTVRPCPEKRPCSCMFESTLLFGGLWMGNHRDSCKPLTEIDLPGPVGYIDSIRINGEDVDPFNGDWRIDNGHLLVWQGEGQSPLPAYQDLNKSDDEVGTYSITYSQSYPVLADARLAVAYLAMEFAKAFTPRGKCSLPRGVTSVVRSGVSFTIEAGLFPGGLTGIDIVDQFILKWAPAGSPSRNAQVFDPSKAPLRRTSGVPRRREVGSV